MKSKLFDGQNPVVWSEIKKRAAAKPTWQLHHPRLFEDVKAYAVRMGLWREEGPSIRVGPFPADPTSVIIRERNRNDDTGEATLEIKPVGGTKVIYEIGDGKPGLSAEAVPNYDAFVTSDIAVSFLCVDEGPTQAPLGDHRVWKNRITLKSRIFLQGTTQFCELVAAPAAGIRYTTNGSDPRSHGASYDGAFPVPTGTRIIMAVAGKNGVESDVIRRELGPGSEGVDPTKPLVWKTHRHFQNRPTSEAWQLVERMREYDARADGVAIYYLDPNGHEDLTYNSVSGLSRSSEELKELINRMTGFFEGGNLTLSINQLHFELGQSFLDWTTRDRIAVDLDREVSQ